MINEDLKSTQLSGRIINQYIFTVFLEKYALIDSFDVKNTTQLTEKFRMAQKLAPAINFLKDTSEINIKNPQVFDELRKIKDFDLDVSIFGDIYEKNINICDVKQSGVVYTPDYLVDYTVKSAIVSYLSKGTAKSINEITDNFNHDDLKKKISKIKILDPACGCGNFILKAIDVLSDILKAIGCEADLSDNIFAVDVDEKAVEITKASLFLKLVSRGIKCDADKLDRNITHANTLIDFKSRYKFDVIVGNPPYVNIYKISANKNELKYYQENYTSAYKKFDLYVLFLEKALKLLKKGGVLGYIIPNNFTSQPYGYMIRELLLKHYKITKIVDLSSYNVFKRINANILILFVENNYSNDNIISIQKPVSSKHDITTDNLLTNKIRQDTFLKIRDLSIRLELTDDDIEILRKITKKSISLDEVCFVGVGTRSIPQSKHHIKRKIDDNARRLVVGRDVLKYYINYDGLWLNFIDELYNPMFPELFDNEKIIVRDFLSNNKILMAYDVNNYYTSHTTLCCLLKCQLPNKFSESEAELSCNFSLKFIFAMLSSNLCEYYFKLLYSNGMHVYVNDLRMLPVADINIKSQKYFESVINDLLKLTDEMYGEIESFYEYIGKSNLTRKLKNYYNLSYAEFSSQLKQKGITINSNTENLFNRSCGIVRNLLVKIDYCESRINSKFYDIYGLTPDEVKQIEKYIQLN